MERIFKALNKEFNSITYAALAIGTSSFISLFLGLVRDRVFASKLGASLTVDIYNSAFRIPDLLFVSVASLVSASVIIPFITKKKLGENSEVVVEKFINNTFSAFLLIITVSCTIFFIAMPFLASKIAPGFDADSLRKLTLLSRIMLASPIFIGLSFFFGALTQVHNKFIASALSPIFYNLGIIIGVLVFYPIFGISGLAWGIVLAGIFHMSLPFLILRKDRLLPKIIKKIDWREMKALILISIPRTLALSLNTIAVIIITSFATLIGEGSVSIFTYALHIAPISIIGASYSVAAFPRLSKNFAEDNQKEFMRSFVVAFRQIVLISATITSICIVLRTHIVRVLLGTGNFSWTDTKLTAGTLAVLSLAIIFQNVTLLFIRGFYAGGKTKKPFWANLISSIFLVALAYFGLHLENIFPKINEFILYLFRVENIIGGKIVVISLAYALGTILNSAILYIMFFRDFKIGEYKEALNRAWRDGFIAFSVTTIITLIMLRILNPIFLNEKTVSLFFHAFISGTIGMIISLLILRKMGNEEAIRLSKKILEIFEKGKKKIVPVDF